MSDKYAYIKCPHFVSFRDDYEDELEPWELGFCRCNEIENEICFADQKKCNIFLKLKRKEDE